MEVRKVTNKEKLFRIIADMSNEEAERFVAFMEKQQGAARRENT